MGNSESGILITNATDQLLLLNYYFESRELINLDPIMPNEQLWIKKRGPSCSINVVTTDSESEKIVATFAAQLSLSKKLELKIETKCNDRYYQIVRVLDRYRSNDHFKLKWLSKGLKIPFHYSQVYNDTSFTLKILVSNREKRNTTQIIEPGEVAYVETPEGKNVVQIIDLDTDQLNSASKEEDARPCTIRLGICHKEDIFPNCSTLIAVHVVDKFFRLVDGHLTFSLTKLKWVPATEPFSYKDETEKYNRTHSPYLCGVHY